MKFNIMKCIICNKDKLESDEHIIPAALGNKKFITKRVCERCNNMLGINVDDILVNNKLMQIVRKNSDLDKKNKIKIFKGRENDCDSDRQYDIRGDSISLVATHGLTDEGAFVVEADNHENALEHLKKTLKEKGYDDDKINSMLKNAAFGERVITNPSFEIKTELNFRKLTLPIIKISFEYSHLILGDDYLNDKMAILFSKELNQAISVDKKNVRPTDELAGVVSFLIDSPERITFLYSECIKLINQNFNKTIRHILLLYEQDNFIYCVVSLFLQKQYTFDVKVSENANLYRKKSNIIFVYEDGSSEMF